jgi:hypothetical protein
VTIPRRRDFTRPEPGTKFNRFTILRFETQTVGTGTGTKTFAICRCDCGEQRAVALTILRRGGQKSCGCLQREVVGSMRRTHGMSTTNLYKVWATMVMRCTNPAVAAYINYGGRGISVCAEWRNFEPFCDWALANGYKRGLTIDRIDNDSGYRPDNCRWATRKQNANNKRSNRFLEHAGKRMTVAQWADLLNIPISCINRRLHRGESDERALRERRSRNDR